MKTTKFLKNFVFQTYGVENIKLIASERRSSNIVPEMVLFPNIYIYIYIYIYLIWSLKNGWSFSANKF